jgi:hypothetical protein
LAGSLTARINLVRILLRRDILRALNVAANVSSLYLKIRADSRRLLRDIYLSAGGICGRIKVIFFSRCGKTSLRARFFRSAKKRRATRANWHGNLFRAGQ